MSDRPQMTQKKSTKRPVFTTLSGVLVASLGSTALAQVVVAPGTTQTNTGALSGPVTNNGAFNNNGVGVLTGALINNSGGVATNQASATINGDVTNNAGGTLHNAGTITATTVTNSGDFGNSGGGTITATALVNNAGGQLISNGAIAAAVDNNGTLILDGAGTLTGDVANSGFLATRPLATIVGGVTTESGGTTENAGTITGALVVDAGGTATNTSSGTIGGAVTNNGTFNNLGGTLSAGFTNVSTLNVNGSTFAAGLTNTGGTVNSNGTTNITGAGINTGTFSMADGTADDRLNFNGGLSSTGGIYALDVNLGVDPGEADVISVTGATSGDLSFDFSVLSSGALQATPTLVFDADNGVANSFTFSQTGLPTTGLVVYGLVIVDEAGTTVGGGDSLAILSQVNPAVGNLAAGISLTQDMVSAVVNRPSSPFVSGLATGEACSKGGWARGTGGKASLSGDSTSTAGGVTSTTTAEIDANYYGLQAGFDAGCFDARYGGWDLAFGGSIGVNHGETSQNVYDAVINPLTGFASLDLTTITGGTETEFDQYTYGAYVAGRKGKFTADFQLRYDTSDFTLNDYANPGFLRLGLTDVKYDSKSTTASTRINYAFELPAENMTFIPTAGFSHSNTKSSVITFDSGDTLTVDDYKTKIGFIGGTLAKTIIAPSGTAGTTYFASANYYNDFSDDRMMTFQAAGGGATNTIATTNLGKFGEVSVGLNHVAILSGNTGSGGIKQVNASLRLDTRFGDAISDAHSLTGQVRFSF